ncbi:MAG: MBL fold metallo-hydrolase [Ignavibacteriales bacterium]|nr:MAG: MBL fold metallo-hydrolase [Ignavibacteriales bacterium]
MFNKILLLFFILFLTTLICAQNKFEKDVIKTSGGDLEITFIGHGTLMFNFNGIIIHADPFSKLADYTVLPDADIILVTHHHGDHFDPEAIEKIRKENTTIILTELCTEKFDGGTVMGNSDVQTINEIQIEAVPAYNLIHKRDNGEPYHVKGTCNGYVITFGDKRVYVAGDTENTPEMKALEEIDIAFLPMNLPYTMTPEMVADAAKAFKPGILYPYHFGETDVAELTSLMKDEKDVEVRLRKMK